MPSKRISKRRTRRNNRTYKKVVRRINRTKKKYTMRKQRINRRKYSNRKRTNRKRTNRKQVRGGAGNVPTAAALSQDQQEGFFTFKKAFFFFSSQIPLITGATPRWKEEMIKRDKKILRLFGLNYAYHAIHEIPQFDFKTREIENTTQNFISMCYLKYKLIQSELEHEENIKSTENKIKIYPEDYKKKQYTREDIFEIFIKDLAFSSFINENKLDKEYLKNLIFNYDEICRTSTDIMENTIYITLGSGLKTDAKDDYKPDNLDPWFDQGSQISLKDINEILQEDKKTKSQEVIDLLNNQYIMYVDKVIKQSKNVYNQYSDDKYRFSKNHISKCSVLLPVLKQASFVMSQGNYNDKLQEASDPEELVKLTDIREEQNKSVLLSYALKMIDSIIHDSNLESMIELSSPLLSDKTSTYMSYGLVPLGIAEYLEGNAGGDDAVNYRNLFKYLYYTLNTPLTHLVDIIDTFDLHIHKHYLYFFQYMNL